MKHNPDTTPTPDATSSPRGEFERLSFGFSRRKRTVERLRALTKELDLRFMVLTVERALDVLEALVRVSREGYIIVARPASMQPQDGEHRIIFP